MNREEKALAISQMLTVVAEAMQNSITPAAILLMTDDLMNFDLPVIEKALHRVRRECRQLIPQEIFARIDDGRPNVEEAWAMLPRDESETIVWTEEMAEAYGVCSALITEGDKVAARMAFKEKYTALLAQSRAEFRRVQWSATLGTDKTAREDALKLAVETGKLSADHARKLLPDLSYRITPNGRKLLNGVSQAVALLESGDKPNYQRNGEHAAKILDEIFGRKPAYKPEKPRHLVAIGSLSPCGTARFIGGDPADPHAWELIEINQKRIGAAR